MPLTKTDLTNNEIYLEERGTLASRIDFAWEAYNNELYTEGERKAALKFLIYALDIGETENLNGQLIQLMAEREKYQFTNPEYIPGKSPSRIPFDPRTVIPKKTRSYKSPNPDIQHSSEINTLRTAIHKDELLDVNTDSKAKDVSHSTIFLTPEERAKYRVNISGGLFQKNGKPFDTSNMQSHGKKGFAAYTMNSNGEISVFTHVGMRDKIAHSSMNAGAPVVAAGELKIEKGVIKAITTHSGHYQPGLFTVARALEHLSVNGVDISQAKVITTISPSVYFNSIKSKKVFYPAYNDYMYEAPASQIYKQMDKLIDESVNSINAQMKSYQKGGLRTSLFSLKDRVTGSTLTQDRAKLAAELATELDGEITRFKQEIKGLAPEFLPGKIDELGALITSYQKRNEELSTTVNKNESSGRLASTMKSFKNKLGELKTHAEEHVEIEDSAAKMKLIH